MKKIIAVCLVLVLTVSFFVGCGGDKKTTGEKEITIGLVQLVEHRSLDEIREAFTTEMETLSAAKGMKINIIYKNAQNDMSLINTICRGFVDEKVDVIVAIATPTVQGAASVTTEIPIVFSAVTDPIGAGLLTDLNAPSGNITGTSDAIAVEEIFQLAEELTPGIKTYGFIYNKGESNSVSVIEQAKVYLDTKGIAYTEKLVTNSGEVQISSRVLLEECDAVFAPIDNTVADGMGILASEAIAAGKPVYVAADSMVADGGLATKGVNYTELGQKTAGMTLKVLEGTPISQLPVEVMTDTRVVVNEETAKALGIDVSKYLTK